MERQQITRTEDAITRGQLESDILQQTQNEIEEVLLLHAPTTWSDERLDEIERHIIDHTKMVVTALSTTELQSSGGLQRHIWRAVTECKRLIHQGGCGGSHDE